MHGTVYREESVRSEIWDADCNRCVFFIGIVVHNRSVFILGRARNVSQYDKCSSTPCSLPRGGFLVRIPLTWDFFRTKKSIYTFLVESALRE